MSSSSREWKWVNAITREVEYVDLWYKILIKIRDNFPTAYSAAELLKPPEKRHLLKSDLAWGISDNNIQSSGKIATFNVTHNNSPQRMRWVGGTRRRILQFVITEFTYLWVQGSNTDVSDNPPYQYMATKNIFEHMLSANSEWLKDEGVSFIANPSVIQDGKNFANFAIGSDLGGVQFFLDNNKWKNVLLWQMEVLEDLV